MLRTYMKPNKLNHTYMRYTGESNTGGAVGTFRILTEDGVNITTEGNDKIVTENA